MALTSDQLRHLSRLYDRWQSGDASERLAIERELDASGADVAHAFISMTQRADTLSGTERLPPIPQAVREQAIQAVAVSSITLDDTVTRFRVTKPPPDVDSPIDALLSRALPERRAGQHVGPYRLVKELGRGGMGVVWLAERADGQHSRQVALKMPLVENLNWLLAARFARERRILASLEHASIARLYDAGVDDKTQPYIAIEYVVGVPITTYVHENKLKPEAIVLLFTRVIEAVAHAHAQLVIHRDIKPTNILVDAKGAPHLLDFGIAKLLDDDDDTAAPEATQLTRLSGRALTLDYASPEQVSGAPLGTASDVYALGVVLYELLTGRRPQQPKSATRRDLELAILEQEPLKPSEHLLLTGDSEAGKSARRMRGDLDTIVLKALRKDPKARYATANAFADDLRRYLAYEPIQARPDGVIYRLAKFIRRQRVSLAVAAVSSIAIAGFGVRAWQQQQVAQASAARAAGVDGLIRSVFEGMSPDAATAQTFSAEELLDRARRYLNTSTFTDASARRQALNRLASLYGEVGSNAKAIELYEAEIAMAAATKDTHNEALAMARAAERYLNTRQYDKADLHLSVLRGKLAGITRPHSDLVAQLEFVSAVSHLYQDRAAVAQNHYARALAAWRDSPDGDQRLYADILQGQGYAARATGDLTGARQHLLDALAVYERILGRISLDFLVTSATLGGVEHSAGRYAVALATLTPVVRDIEIRLGGNHPSSLAAWRSLAEAQMRSGKFADARATLEKLRVNASALTSAETQFADAVDAMILMHEGDFDRALSRMQDVLRRVPADTVGTARLTRAHGEILLRAGKSLAAREVLSATEQVQVRLLGEQHPDVAMTRVLMAVERARAGELAEAKAVVDRAATILLLSREFHPATLAAESYALLFLRADRAPDQPSQPTGVKPARLADRLDKELVWQAGAHELASWLRAYPARTDWKNLPVAF